MQEKFLNQLNTSQKQAVTTIEGALLILAGAGSGKTKTITTRLAYLIDEVGIPPSNTLTLTFTNKAANEMQKRALNMLKKSTSHPPLLCTFHKFGLLFLKFYISLLGRKINFILADSDDTKKILKELNCDLAPLPLIISEISRYKNSQITPQEALKNAHNELYKHIAKVYLNYQETLLQNNMVDFDDLLLLPIEILKSNPNVATEISQKYQYIMVDEYQDTNDLQYQLLKYLCTTHNNICVVGDDDQSIYSWRGANIQNILNFSQHFKGAKTIKLEENYRSSKSILNAANHLISNNKERLGKTLKSTLDEGKPIEVLHSYDEQEEAKNLSKIIKKLLQNGINPKDIAILFRLNALSRSLEEGFNRERIPYVLVGTIRFYERSEIKDVISYFRVLTNINDDFSLLRIINKPKRGIGKTTLEKLKSLSQIHHCSIYELFSNQSPQLLQQEISKKTYNTIWEFFKTIKELQDLQAQSSLKFLDDFEEKIGLCKALSQNSEEVDRVSNIEEFYGLYREYVKQNPLMELEDFLNELALRSDQEDTELRNEQKGVEGVSCMSVHSSKGLEFDYVFIIGLEEGFFPMAREDTNLQEERRLGYVAFTRAKKELYLSYVDSRFYRGNRTSLYPSRFLAESKILAKENFLNQNTTDISKTAYEIGFQRGDCVMHKIFGAGRITEITKSGQEIKLKINFGGLLREILSGYVTKV
ncbi:ATP-dependent helicase [Helicobacter canadensis]|uniref:DNA 3'-5' helicase n=1 Tax=Helicobacter canadensis MIT 98-5491 TaxID=537970 RepID=C5ZXI3_9HELI|nr:UvrD-helicase domain-containing protein [Helicobacter canadensis]EES89851.1 ATP-dependent DNA helicase PcrA [Helicobacter canadensis MIT 98-5491]EFR48651.1 putative ATP-dependent helicase PcrA [Helicobacter canadensis MIT 98-5491]STO99893.1 ATP-dependent DNA helicase [Helicobacter canadensis]